MSASSTLTINDLSGLHDAARELIGLCGDQRIMAFYGEMGAGKTTLIKEICKALGVNEATSSPTFSIVNEYHSDQGFPVFHFDFYRIKDETEAIAMGLDEYLCSGNYCLMEWPEKIPNLLPPDVVKIAVEVGPRSERIITLSKP